MPGGNLRFTSWFSQLLAARKLMSVSCCIFPHTFLAKIGTGIHTNVSSTVLTVLLGMAITGATVCSTTMVQLNQKHEYIGIATAMAITSRSVGGSLATTIYTTIIGTKVSTNLAPDVAKALLAAGLPSSAVPEAVRAIEGGNTAALAKFPAAIVQAGALAMKMTYVDAFKMVYYVSISFGVLGCLAAFSTAEVGHLLTEKVDIKLRETNPVIPIEHKDEKN
jgi:hypothetical protein